MIILFSINFRWFPLGNRYPFVNRSIVGPWRRLVGYKETIIFLEAFLIFKKTIRAQWIQINPTLPSNIVYGASLQIH